NLKLSAHPQNGLNDAAVKKLKDLRNILLLSFSQVERGARLKKNKYSKIESGSILSNLNTIGSLINFYGIEYHDFFNFEKELPDEKTLRRKIEAYHKRHNSSDYKVIYEQPDLIEFIEFRLLKTSLFADWVTAEQLVTYCKGNHKYDYIVSSARNTLNNAVKKGWLVVDDKAKPKRYKRKDEGNKSRP